ncbi:MAG TPA: hypothetical protein VFH97_00770 [Gemmatimonadales bacterium]|nr:hypothetical protein [Gemmatimonadales bacterium]
MSDRLPPMRLLLVHGLGRTPLSMVGLSRHLRRHGYPCRLFGYQAAFRSFAGIVARLRRRLESLAGGGAPYGVIGHSMGGLLLRAALPGLPLPRHFIMLGVPNRPPRLARRVRRIWLYRLVNGDPGQRLADPGFYAELPPPPPYTIITGTAGPRGRWSPFGDFPNDGLVAVDETLVRDHDRPILLPVGHTFMMARRSVRAAVVEALGRPEGT